MTDSVVDLYARVPTLKCKGLCHQSCGIILLQQEEYERIHAVVGEMPAKEAGFAEASVAKPADEQLTCPFLKSRRCSIHDVRPLVCRIWGTVKTVRSKAHCPHGCRPERWLTDAEAHGLIDEAIAIDPRQRALHADVDRVVRAGVGGLS